MAFRKDEAFSPEDRRLATLAKALGHPARLHILRTLAERGTCVCGEIVSGLPLAQSTVSQHLKALKKAGLIRGEIEGPKSCYCVDGAAVAEVAGTLEKLSAGIRTDAEACC